MLPAVALALDVASAIGMLVVAVSFVRLWMISKTPLHLLFGVAFGTLAAGFASVGASAYDLARAPLWVDGFHIFCHTAAPTMLAIGYWLARRDAEVDPAKVMAIAFVVAGALVALVWLASPSGDFAWANPRLSHTIAHTLHFVLYLALVVLSARKFLGMPTWRRALVPLAFLAYAFSKYTWILIDTQDAQGLIPFVYFWRFEMVILLLAALAVPFFQGARSDAPS